MKRTVRRRPKKHTLAVEMQIYYTKQRKEARNRVSDAMINAREIIKQRGQVSSCLR